MRGSVSCLWRLATPLLIALALPTAAAQSAERVSLDLGAGFAYGFGGDYRSRGGVALHTSASAALWRYPTGALRAVVTGDILHGHLGGSDVCHVGPSGECIVDFPYLAGFGFGLAWQRTGPEALFPRIMLGAGRYLDEGDYDASVGFQARASIAELTTAHVAAVLSSHALVLPRLHGDALAVLSFTLGLRFK